ncbi:hypothetical protein M9H77_13467 [Catharanthus roseus]|uniref:Uncharacterized protein n=1 Tax=Catharanthus roseus TaxID=4058 RepID=A0ACC0BKH4_CATRO|nr:hypothetical protein M9H77_13467 [Catharanthus roseus]
MFSSQISSERSRAQQATKTRIVCKVSFYVVMVLFYSGAYNLVPRGTQMPYSAIVDLVAGLGASQMAHPSLRWTYREGTLVDEPSRTTSSSSSYSLREIVPEREPIPVIDLSDDESVEGPEMAPVAPGIGFGTSIEEASEPTSDSEMRPEPQREAPAITRVWVPL